MKNKEDIKKNIKQQYGDDLTNEDIGQMIDEVVGEYQKELLQAYDVVMGTIERLKGAGIEIEIIPKNSKDSAKFHELAVDKWVEVCLYPKDKFQAKLVRKAHYELMELGISFDAGGMAGSGGADWQIDWSFGVNKNDNDYKAKVSQMYQMIDDFSAEIEKDR